MVEQDEILKRYDSGISNNNYLIKDFQSKRYLLITRELVGEHYSYWILAKGMKSIQEYIVKNELVEIEI